MTAIEDFRSGAFLPPFYFDLDRNNDVFPKTKKSQYSSSGTNTVEHGVPLPLIS